MGIQFGWGLQLANMSGIYSQLGANPDEIPILWLAGPMTGLLVQPIIGSMSDRTWNRLGRRRPYFLVGAILSSIALHFVANDGGRRHCVGFDSFDAVRDFVGFVAAAAHGRIYGRF